MKRQRLLDSDDEELQMNNQFDDWCKARKEFGAMIQNYSQLDMLIMHFWQVMDTLSQFDAFLTDHPVNSHHACIVALLDNLNLLDSRNLLLHMLIALGSQIGQLLAIGHFKRGVSYVLASFIPLLNKETRPHEQDPALLIIALPLNRL